MMVDEDFQPARRGWPRRIARLAVAVVATYAAVCVLLYLFQSHLIYFPTRDYRATPSDVGLEFEDLRIETRDGISIAAWHISHSDPKGSIIFCHGNAGNIADRLYSVKLLHDLRYNVLIFDYRGFGRSEGSPSEAGTYEDAEAAWRHLVKAKGESPSRVVVFGRSLGGAVAVELAHRHRPAALVVESTFTCLADIGRIHYPLIPVSLLLKSRYDSLSKVSAIPCPKLFLHGIEDNLIPITNARRLFDAAAPPKEFIETPGGHNTGGFTYGTKYAARLGAFLDAALETSAR